MLKGCSSALANGRCVGRPWFNHQRFWFSLFVIQVILREVMDSLLLNVVGLTKLCTHESLFSSTSREQMRKFPWCKKATFGTYFWFFLSLFLNVKNYLLICSISLNIFYRLYLTNRGCWIFSHLCKSLYYGNVISSQLVKSWIISQVVGNRKYR